MTQADQNLLLKMVEQIRDDFAAERSSAHESRVAVHRRLDDFSDRLSRLDTSTAIAGQVDAQVRNELDKLNAKVDANHAATAPSVAEWMRIRRLGLGIVGLMTAGGITFGASAQWGWDALMHLVQNWHHP